VKSAAAALGVLGLAALACTVLDAPPDPSPRLVVRAPNLERPLSESDPAASTPEDPVKKAVFARINADRASQGVAPVAWDAAASRVADLYTAAQVREDVRGHFLLDGIPPYARTAFAGIFGFGQENSVAWTTTGSSFSEPSVDLAVDGEASMFGEKPPNDGHRVTILDPDATHVGVGWAQGGSRFRMAEEFLTRRLAELTLELVASDPATVLFRGRPIPGQHLQFVTLAMEPGPRPISRSEAASRTRYTYPDPHLAFGPEGIRSFRVVGVRTEDRIRMGQAGDFSFRFTPMQPGLWTIVFHLSDGRERPKNGGLAVLRVEKAPAP
jgi:cysteine-rich secretory family protein